MSEPKGLGMGMIDNMQPWQKGAVFLVMVVFSAGMTYNAISNNTDKISINTSDIKEHCVYDDQRHSEIVERIHKRELEYIEVKTLLAGIDERTKEIKEYLMNWEPEDAVQK
jgi:hypothetical protein